MSEHDTKGTTDFDHAKAVADILRAHDKAAQERILRWVSESLQISWAPARPPLESYGGASPPALIPAVRASGAVDIKSFVARKQPKSDVQFATVVAYYYRFEADEAGRKDAISKSDLQEAARLADWDRFKKPYVPLQNAANQGYLDRAARGAFRINAVGENLVAMALPGGGENKPDASGRRGRHNRRPGRPGSKKAKRARSPA